jgi:hypothetical protein
MQSTLSQDIEILRESIAALPLPRPGHRLIVSGLTTIPFQKLNWRHLFENGPGKPHGRATAQLNFGPLLVPIVGANLCMHYGQTNPGYRGFRFQCGGWRVNGQFHWNCGKNYAKGVV